MYASQGGQNAFAVIHFFGMAYTFILAALHIIMARTLTHRFAWAYRGTIITTIISSLINLVLFGLFLLDDIAERSPLASDQMVSLLFIVIAFIPTLLIVIPAGILLYLITRPALRKQLQ